jgi:small subunit ribosomal protein S18
MSERAKIRARRVTGNDTQQQREIARAIRVAREMALLPYSVRQVTHRSKRRGERGERDDDRRELAAPAAPEAVEETVIGAEGVDDLVAEVTTGGEGEE